jgi:transmembrane sensor
MKQEDKLWHLMSRKLSGEATVAELEELLEMLNKDPAIYYTMKIISELWKQKGNIDKDRLEAAYRKHLLRSGISFSKN